MNGARRTERCSTPSRRSARMMLPFACTDLRFHFGLRDEGESQEHNPGANSRSSCHPKPIESGGFVYLTAILLRNDYAV